MKSKLFAFALLAGLAMPLAACSGDTPSGGGSSGNPDTSSAGDTSGESSSGETSSEDPSVFNIAKIKENLASFKNFKAVLSSDMVGDVDAGDFTYQTNQTGSLVLEVDHKSFTFKEDSTNTQVMPLDKVLEAYSMTKEELVAMIEASGQTVTLDEANNKLTTVSERDMPLLTYKYDTTLDQHIKYTYYNSVVDAKYVTYGDNYVMVKAYYGLFSTIVNSGTPDAEHNKIVYTITDEYRKSQEYMTVTDDGDLFSSFELQVENNLPKKLVFNYDPERVKESMGEGITTTRMDMTFSNIGTTTLDLPTNTVDCAHHSKYGTYDEESHYYYCQDCGKILDGKHAHVLDEHGVCKVCGYVDGLGGGNSMTSVDYVEANKIGDSNVYAFRYYVSAKNEIYNVRYFYDSVKRSSDYQRYGSVYYNVELGAAIVRKAGTQDYMADDSCVLVSEDTLSLYTGLTIVDDAVPTINDTPINEYLATQEAAATIKERFVELCHDEETAKENIDSCHETITETCQRCHEVFEIQQRTQHKDIIFTDNGKTSLESFKNKFGRSYGYTTFTDNYSYYSAHCAECDSAGEHDLYVVISNDDCEEHTRHTTTEYVYEKKGSRTIRTYTPYNYLPHIADYNNNCFLCGEYIRGITNTEVELGVKVSSDGTYIEHYDFTINHLSGDSFDELYEDAIIGTSVGAHSVTYTHEVRDRSTHAVKFVYDETIDDSVPATIVGLKINKDSYKDYTFPAE